MRRPVLKTTLALAILLVMAALVSYVLLLTALPGRWILDAADDASGLHVTAESFSVGWFGRTRIRNVKVTLPLSNEDVLSAQEIEVSHRSIPGLLLTRALDLGRVQIDGATIHMRRDNSGRWNLQDAWTRIDAGRTPNDRSGRVALPLVELRNATVHIADANGAAETIGPVTFTGQPEKGGRWTFSLQTQPQIEAQGQLAPGRDWAHAVGFDLDALGPVLRAVHGPNVEPLQVAGRWEGRVTNGALLGRLDLDRLQAGRLVLQGAVDVTAGAEGVMLRSAGLTMSEPNIAGAPVRLTSGLVRASASELRAERLRIQAGDITASLDGLWDNTAHLGTLAGAWTLAQGTNGSEHEGTYAVVLRSPPLGRKEADVDLTARLEASGRIGHVTAQLQGDGATWQTSNWELSVPKFTWDDDPKAVDLSGARAEIAVDWPQTRLTSLHLPNAQQVRAQMQIDAATVQWSAQVDANALSVTPWLDEPIDIHLDARGDEEKVTISKFGVLQGRRTLAAEGELSLSDRSVRTVHIVADWSDDDKSAPETTKPPARWRYEANVSGPFRPAALKVKGALSGANVPLGKQMVDQVDVTVQADVDDERVTVTTEPFTLLGGQWQIRGRHDWSARLTQLSLAVDELSLKAAADMAGSPLQCEGRVKADLQLAAFGSGLDDAIAFGGWSAEAVRIPPFRAERASGKVHIADGLVRFDEIQLEQAAGQAQGRMQFRLDRPQLLTLGFKTQDWPVRWEDRALELYLDGTADAQVDVLAKTLNGEGQLAGHLLWQEKELGRTTLSGSIRKRTLTIREWHAETLGGTLDGTAEIPLDRWSSGVGQLQWQGIEPNALAPWWPAAARVQGRLSGSLTAAQAKNEARPPEPMRLDLYTELSEGQIGTSQLRGGQVVAYLGPRRLLIDQANFQLLGGQFNGRARVTPHVGKLYTTVVMDANDLDLNQLVHVIHPEAGEVVGRLAGRGNLLFSSDLASFSGQADLNLSESDLANNSVVRTLYDTMNLSLGSSKPEGTGQMRIQQDGVRTLIPSFVYFNRGVETRGAGEIADFRLGSASPVTGYAFGSTRVLKGIALPGVRELDRLMSSLQTGVASVQIDGELGQPKVAVVPLPSLTDPLRRLLWTQLRSGQQSQSNP